MTCDCEGCETLRTRRRAAYHVQRALKRGELIRLPCEACGATYRVQAHHDDYSRTVDVRWLCPKHHHERHREIWGPDWMRRGRIVTLCLREHEHIDMRVRYPKTFAFPSEQRCRTMLPSKAGYGLDTIYTAIQCGVRVTGANTHCWHHRDPNHVR
jgi:hypothetical protein